MPPLVVTSRAYSAGRSSPPMKTFGLRWVMPLGDLLEGREMNLAGAGLAHAARDVARGDAAAGHHDQAPGRQLDQAPDQRRAFQHARLLAGGQQAVDAEADQGLQRFGRIARHVERAMEGDGERPRRRDQPLGQLGVDLAVGGEAAEHHAAGARRLGRGDVAQHHLDLDLGIEEVAAARPDHHLHRQLGARDRRLHQAEAGRGAALQQVGAQFDTGCAGLLGGDGALHRIDADFRDQSGHEKALMPVLSACPIIDPTSSSRSMRDFSGSR